jgi:ribosomal protein S18 acetylase RimI-like enzyme
MSISLRAAVDGDLPAVGALHCRSRRAAYAHILPAETLGSLSAEALGAWWTERRRWEGETHQLTVAEADGRVVGFSYVGPSETEGATELYAIHVEPDLIGTGAGRLLMVDALERLAAMGGDRAVLWVLEDNERARGFYDRGGWAADGTTRMEPVGGEPVPQLRYSRRL